jgi:hypothetical protein
MIPLSGLETIRKIRGETDTILLSFSCGKDSVAAWLECRKYFPTIIPYYLYLVPDLSFVNQAIDYYEQFFKTKIVQLPHPSLLCLLNNLVFQAPENCLKIEKANLPTIDYDDQVYEAARISGYAGSPWTAVGVRAADSLLRRVTINRFGTINGRQRKFYPVWDWKKAKLIEELSFAKIKLPVDYKMFGRSFDGIDYRFLAPIKKYFPEDYKRILDVFPLAGLEIKRREYHEKHQRPI